MKKFDFLEVAGTYKDLGQAIGKKFGPIIKRQIERRKKRIKNYELYLEKNRPYFDLVAKSFPDLFVEMEEAAKASGVDPIEYFAVNNREVPTEIAEYDHCTVAVYFGDKGPVIGHNEDWEDTNPTALYILRATVGPTTFFGLQYKATIPGVSVTTNNWGLTQCINDLNNGSEIGIPKNFLARAVLECKTLDEAEKLIRSAKRASGFNHVLIQGREVRNIEVAAGRLSVQRVFGNPYVHTNHYLSPRLASFEKYRTVSSVERYKRASELIKETKSVGDMERLLSDRGNRKFPILRGKRTLGSLVFDIAGKKAFIRYGGDGREKFVEYDL